MATSNPQEAGPIVWKFLHAVAGAAKTPRDPLYPVALRAIEAAGLTFPCFECRRSFLAFMTLTCRLNLEAEPTSDLAVVMVQFHTAVNLKRGVIDQPPMALLAEKSRSPPFPTRSELLRMLCNALRYPAVDRCVQTDEEASKLETIATGHEQLTERCEAAALQRTRIWNAWRHLAETVCVFDREVWHTQREGVGGDEVTWEALCACGSAEEALALLSA